MGELGENPNLELIRKLKDDLPPAESKESLGRIGEVAVLQQRFEDTLHIIKTLIGNGKNFLGIEDNIEAQEQAKKYAQEAERDLEILEKAFKNFQELREKMGDEYMLEEKRQHFEHPGGQIFTFEVKPILDKYAPADE